MLKNQIWSKEFLAGPVAMAVLIVFQILFSFSALMQSGYVYYRVYHIGEDQLRYYNTVRAEIGPQLLGMLAVLILAELVICWGLKKLGLSATPVVVPLFVLLTISMVYQTFVRSPKNSLKHFITILLGLAVMLFSMCFIRVFSWIKISDAAFRCMLYLCWGLCLLNLVVGLFQGINNAGAFLNLGLFNFQPGEFMKLLNVFLVGIGFTQILRDKVTCHLLLFTMFVELCTLVLVRDIGNAFILFLVGLTVILLRYGTRTAGILMGVTIAGAWAGYSVLTLILPEEHRILWRVSNTFQAMAASMDGRINRDIRTALFAALRGGIFGTGVANNTYILNNSYIYTDFVFDVLISFFGVAGALLAVSCIVLLILHSRTDLEHSGQDIIFFVYSNLMVVIIGVQTTIHVGGNLNVIPFTGVVFPFLSSGGSAMIAAFMELGLALGGRIQSQWVAQLKGPLGYAVEKVGDLLMPVGSVVDDWVVDHLIMVEQHLPRKWRAVAGDGKESWVEYDTVEEEENMDAGVK